MKVNVFYDRDNTEQTVELDNDTSVKELLTKIKINPVTVIVSRDDDIIMEDEKVNDNDKIKLISVISGG